MGHTREYPAFVERGTQPGISGLFSVYDTQASRTRTRTYSYHTRRVRHLLSYGIAFNDLEMPVTTWVQVLGTYVYYLGGVYYLDGKPWLQGEASSPLAVFRRAKNRTKAVILCLYETSTSE